jgi:hypothetical protein
MFKCGKKKCKICENVIIGATFKSHVEGRSFCINHRFDCDSEGIVYLISCKFCVLQYVGNTITPFRLGFNNHKSALIKYIWAGAEKYLWATIVCQFLGGGTFRSK